VEFLNPTTGGTLNYHYVFKFVSEPIVLHLLVFQFIYLSPARFGAFPSPSSETFEVSNIDDNRPDLV
jgi:hypothetical protein